MIPHFSFKRVERAARRGAMLAAIGATVFCNGAHAAFNSGSTGADGAFNPTVNTQLTLPASGIFNFTTVNIPSGVTVTFVKNTANTPVTILASGDVTIAGIIDIKGQNAKDNGASGGGLVGDDGLPGTGGPGGYAGGAGGQPNASVSSTVRNAGDGLGPGGGMHGELISGAFQGGGGGGGYAVAGTNGANANSVSSKGGAAYGSSALLPLIGGSGGGGAFGGSILAGTGGGGGGGAILIASSGVVTITGSILATGGFSGSVSGAGQGGTGGGGSGGAIRIVATTITGNGTLNAAGGTTGSGASPNDVGGVGAVGRIRLESEIYTRTAASTPAHTFGMPGALFIPGQPTLRIKNVAGTAVPLNPTGVADVQLPSNIVNPVTVDFETVGVPVGNTVKLVVTPAYGASITAVSNAISGSTMLGTSSVPVSLPQGPSTLMAQITYTITLGMGEALSQFANNERVEKVMLVAGLKGPGQVKLITVSGKEFDAPKAALDLLMQGQG